VGFCCRDRGRAALDGQEIRPCWVPVVGLQDSRRAAPELIGLDNLAGSDQDPGRFWRDVES
jgi:hypothetical protein